MLLMVFSFRLFKMLTVRCSDIKLSSALHWHAPVRFIPTTASVSFYLVF